MNKTISKRQAERCSDKESNQILFVRQRAVIIKKALRQKNPL